MAKIMIKHWTSWWLDFHFDRIDSKLLFLLNNLNIKEGIHKCITTFSDIWNKSITSSSSSSLLSFWNSNKNSSILNLNVKYWSGWSEQRGQNGHTNHLFIVDYSIFFLLVGLTQSHQVCLTHNNRSGFKIFFFSKLS